MAILAAAVILLAAAFLNLVCNVYLERRVRSQALGVHHKL